MHGRAAQRRHTILVACGREFPSLLAPTNLFGTRLSRRTRTGHCHRKRVTRYLDVFIPPQPNEPQELPPGEAELPEVERIRDAERCPVCHHRVAVRTSSYC